MENENSAGKIKEAVRERYGGIARHVTETSGQASCCGPAQAGCGCGATTAVEPQILGVPLYTKNELSGLPASVTDAALGCGNPTAIAGLKPGEVVLDLGSGGGIDCFLAAQRVGPTGRVIGLDMTPDMVRLANANAQKAGITNVEFKQGEMEAIPLPDASVDVIISNCVVNLSPDKDSVFREAYRVLRPGGRVSISDMVVSRELPPVIRQQMNAWAGCVAGALAEADYLGKMRAAGFQDVTVASRDVLALGNLPAGAGPDEAVAAVADALGLAEVEIRALLHEAGMSVDELSGLVASIKVTARKAG